MIGNSLGIKTKQRYVDIINIGDDHNKTELSGEEIAANVISKMGLKVVSDG